ncbi:MAG: quinone-dependent dihydroorotate dehydrogenase [Pseudomonadota bacterium]|nr:quinone-dependent dihydroorotate dehydrogenase [Pseudomonadota bacterium]
MSPYTFILRALRCLPPEAAHKLTIKALSLGLGPKDRTPDDPSLATSVWGLNFPNPVGLSAGFDKGAEVSNRMLAAGFGFVEAGTVTPLPQKGNPKPRMFRLNKDLAAINRLGFNGTGLSPYVRRISTRYKGAGLLGANVGKNKKTIDGAGDYEIGIEAVAKYVDYLVINISSPNTPGLRTMQNRENLIQLIQRAKGARARAVSDASRHPPLVVKIAPDLSNEERADIASVITEYEIDGLTVANTTVARPTGLRDPKAREDGGLSGAPLFPLAIMMVEDMYKRTEGQVPIIGSGGIASGADAYAMIRAGASLVQLYTALVFRGPLLIPQIKHELAFLLAKDGFKSVNDAVGTNVRMVE